MRREISASRFKARCFGLMDQVAPDGDVLVITRNGRPVAEPHPFAHSGRVSPFGLHRDIQLLGDVVASLDEPWEALR
ncbi:MAG: type II toxin-antitoxin system Phd/YefM family antitoxin [Cyanobium sp.]